MHFHWFKLIASNLHVFWYEIDDQNWVRWPSFNSLNTDNEKWTGNNETCVLMCTFPCLDHVRYWTGYDIVECRWTIRNWNALPYAELRWIDDGNWDKSMPPNQIGCDYTRSPRGQVKQTPKRNWICIREYMNKSERNDWKWKKKKNEKSRPAGPSPLSIFLCNIFFFHSIDECNSFYSYSDSIGRVTQSIDYSCRCLTGLAWRHR